MILHDPSLANLDTRSLEVWNQAWVGEDGPKVTPMQKGDPTIEPQALIHL